MLENSGGAEGGEDSQLGHMAHKMQGSQETMEHTKNTKTTHTHKVNIRSNLWQEASWCRNTWDTQWLWDRPSPGLCTCMQAERGTPRRGRCRTGPVGPALTGSAATQLCLSRTHPPQGLNTKEILMIGFVWVFLWTRWKQDNHKVWKEMRYWWKKDVVTSITKNWK